MEKVYKTTDKYNRFNEDNQEILNPTPIAPPVGYKPTLSLVEQIRQQVRMHKHMEDTEPESEEEADDFDIVEDPIVESRWENDMIPSIKETRKRIKELEAQEKRYGQTPEEKPAPKAPEPAPEAPK